MPIVITNGVNLGQLKREVGEVSPDALREGAEHVLKVAKEQAPFLVDVERANRHEEPGTLRDSGDVEVRSDDMAVVIFYDFIASRQHEDLEYHHDIGKAKFLEDPLRSEADEVYRIIADKVREALGT